MKTIFLFIFLVELRCHLCELRLQRAASRPSTNYVCSKASNSLSSGSLHTQLKKIAWISTWIIHANSTWIMQGFLEDRTLIPRGSNLDHIQSPPHDRSTRNPCMIHVESLYDPRGIPVRSTWITDHRGFPRRYPCNFF
uniref:Secreted protein n=1 Tax=Trichogramma kaykai TaxID=54128 RepID=A0ABD2WW52_9HYME